MKALKDIVRMADEELESIANNGKFRSREEIASVGQLVKAVKDAYCVFDMEDGDEYGRYDRTYRARRRDSRGRYMDDGFHDRLRELMDSAPDEATRSALRKMMNNMA